MLDLLCSVRGVNIPADEQLKFYLLSAFSTSGRNMVRSCTTVETLVHVACRESQLEGSLHTLLRY